MIVETKRGKLPVRYGMNALALFGDLTGMTMNQVMSSLDEIGDLKVSELLSFIYVGFVDGARFAGEECKIKSVEEAGDLLDDDKDLINKMFAAFSGDDQGADGGTSKKK